MKKQKKGFSLVELLVAMAIIAVLISIAAFGIQIVQRNARNTRRRKFVQDMILQIQDIQANTLKYPDNTTVNGNDILFQDGNNNLATMTIKGLNPQISSSTLTYNNKTGSCTNCNEEADPNLFTYSLDTNNRGVCTNLEGTQFGFCLGY